MSKKFKILFISNILAPSRALFFSEWGKYVDLTVLVELDGAVSRDLSWKSNKYENFTCIFLHESVFNGDNTSFGIGVVKYIANNFDMFDYIVFGVYTDPSQCLAIEFCRFKNIPFIISDDGSFFTHGKVFVNIIKKQLLKSASACITTSDYSIETLRRYGYNGAIYKYPLSSVRVSDIYNDQDSLNSSSYKKILGISEKKIVLSIGKYIYGKGFDILLKSMADIRLADIGIYIIGGNVTKEYKSIVERNNIKNVHFIPFQTAEKIKQYLRAADCFVLPTRVDVWGLVIIEALSQGVPVITTNMCLAGVELITQGENGYIVPVDNYIALREKIYSIICNDYLAMKMKENNLAKAYDYTVEKMVEVHNRIFSLIDNEGRHI